MLPPLLPPGQGGAGPHWLTRGTFVPLSHIPRGHHKQVKWDLGKRSALLLFSVVTAKVFYFLLSEKTDSLVPDSLLDRSSFTARLVCPLLLVQRRFSSPACLLQVSSQALVIAVVYTRMPLPTHMFQLHLLPETGVGLISFVVLVLFFHKAFQIAPLKVTLKMLLVKMKGKFHLTFFPFDISIGLGFFVFNFSAKIAGQ